MGRLRLSFDVWGNRGQSQVWLSIQPASVFGFDDSK